MVLRQEEVAKRTARAARFNMPGLALEYKPDEEEEAKRRRAQKWGTTYTPVTDMVIMDLGTHDSTAVSTELSLAQHLRATQHTVHIAGTTPIHTLPADARHLSRCPPFIPKSISRRLQICLNQSTPRFRTGYATYIHN